MVGYLHQPMRRQKAGITGDNDFYHVLFLRYLWGLQSRRVKSEVLWDGFNHLALLGSAEIVRSLHPDLAAIERMDCAGVIVTAPGDKSFDFISRYFAPAKGIPEDPVTGGAHCALAPFWAGRLGKTNFRAFQASRRGGEILCRVLGDRVELEGSCVFYMEGRVEF